MPKARRLMANAALFLTVAAIIILVVRFPGCAQNPETYVNQSPGSAQTEPVEHVEPVGQVDLAEQFARAAVIEDLSGTVDARTGDVEMAAFRGLGLVREDSLATGGESWASLELTEERFALVGESAEVLVTSLIDGTAENTVFYLDRGTLWVGVKDRLSPGENLTVQTPSVALSVRGTAFSVLATDTETEINVFSGEVALRTQDMSGEPLFGEDGVQTDFSLTAGQSAAITVVSGVVMGVEVLERTSVNAPDDVRDKLEVLMPGTFTDSSGGGPSGTDVTHVTINLRDQGITDERLREMIETGEIPQDVTDLRLASNQISDFSIFNGLPNLTQLYLGYNQISDISALGELTNLTVLYLNHNQISDISALGGLTNLTTLWLNSNQISDISVISRLTNLTSLILGSNQISDISTLGGLTNLTQLQLGGNQISDISVLRGLTNLTQLNLPFNPLNGEINALSGLTSLTTLELSSTQISDIDVLRGMLNLEWLYLTSNQISDISVLSGMTNMRYLYLGHNQISDISALSGMTNLTSLQFDVNQISDISVLGGLTNLTNLQMNDNQFSDISVLSGLTNLTRLVLGHEISESQKDWLRAALPNCEIN